MSETATLTLADFLLARIGGDEAAARAAIGADTDSAGRWEVMQIDYEGCRPAPPGTIAGLGYAYEAEEPWAALLAMHSPARILADCEAKRALISGLTDLAAAGPVDRYNAAVEALSCALRTLSAAYADHPDYRDEWRP